MAAPRVTIDQLPEQTTIVATDLFVVQDGTTTKKMTVARITDDATTKLNAHVNAVSDAHDASAVSAQPNVAPMLGTDVQAQLNQAANGVATGAAHIAAVTDAHDASAISVAAIAGASGTDVQAVLADLVARVVALEAAP
jgi:hypothetical protein